jgi:hypothetical protein
VVTASKNSFLVTITADTPEELKAKIAALADDFGLRVTTSVDPRATQAAVLAAPSPMAEHVNADVIAEKTAAESDAKTAKKRGPKPKTEEQRVRDHVARENAKAAEFSKPETEDEFREEAKRVGLEVQGKFGLNTVSAIFKRFGATNFKTLDPGKMPEFIDACRATLGAMVDGG